MSNVNPMQVIQMMKNGMNPQQIMMSILQDKMGSTPLGQNLINLAQNNQTQEIETIVRNVCSQRGIDYDSAFNSFKQSLGIK